MNQGVQIYKKNFFGNLLRRRLMLSAIPSELPFRMSSRIPKQVPPVASKGFLLVFLSEVLLEVLRDSYRNFSKISLILSGIHPQTFSWLLEFRPFFSKTDFVGISCRISYQAFFQRYCSQNPMRDFCRIL